MRPALGGDGDHCKLAVPSQSSEKINALRRFGAAKEHAMQIPREQYVHCPNISATILRESGLSAPATVTRLWYDGCEMASNESFEVGERIKVVIRGMGSIDAHVTNTAGGSLSAHFIEECQV